MERTDGDTWDLASSVGATATMVAAARAAATRRADPVINDPFAEPLVRAVGLDVFNRVASAGLDFSDLAEGLALPRMVDTFAARARYFDEYFADAAAAGLRQVVIVASGLDARPYRLSWPSGTTVYEIDQPEVIEFKTSTLARIGAAAAAEHRTVGIDLREDWPAALREAGFDATRPAAWLAEGLLIGFLPPEAEVRLLDQVISLSANGSWLAADYGTIVESSAEAQEKARLMTEGWRRQGLDMDVAGLTYSGDHTDVAAHLEADGWETARCKLTDLVVAAGLPELSEADQQAPGAKISFVRAVRTGPAALTGTAHIALTVRDLPTSVAWYRDVLELPVIAEFCEDGRTRRKAVLGNDAIRLGLVQHSASSGAAFDETRIGLDHLAFAVPRGTIQRWAARLDRLGIPRSPVTPSVLRPDQRVLVFRDPDAIQLEFFETN